MANSCPLSNWANNSMIVHAKAPSALGPFTVTSTALLPFHHNVGAAVTADSEYLIYSTGCVVWNDTLVNCTNTNMTMSTSAAAILDAGIVSYSHPNRPPMPPGCTGMTPIAPWMPYHKLCLDGRIRLSKSRSPDGKWKDQPLPVLQPQYDGWDPFTTNAAPLLLPNGSVALVYRGFNVSGTDAIGLAFSEAGPEGPFERISKEGPILTDHAEDPFL